MMTAVAHPERTSRQSPSQERATRTRELFSLALTADSEAERHEPLDDLRQVAALALTKATRGYDVTSGHDFLSYAVPTIRGELRKHFRDHGWMIRPPRRIQELQARINSAEAALSYRLGGSP